MLRRITHAVLERLGGRAQVGERRAQIVARGGHHLALRAQEPVERRAHLVDDGGDVAQLGRACERGAGLELAVGEPPRGLPQVLQRQRDRARDEQCADERRGRRRGGHQRDQRVVARVEHDQARGDDSDQWQSRRQQRQAGQAQAELRQQPQGEASGDADRQAAEREYQRKRRHQVTKR